MTKIITSETMQELLSLINQDINNKANSTHTHTLNNITDLDMTAYPKAVDVTAALNEKSDKTHTHNEFNPMTVEIENNNNNFSVGVDSVGTKYDVIESSESTIELNGQTLVNLWGNKAEHFYYSRTYTSFDNGFITSNANGSSIVSYPKRLELFKPSTEYTVIVNVVENTLDNYFYINSTSDDVIFDSGTISLNAGVTGVFVYKWSTKSDISSATYSLRTRLVSACTTGQIKYQCIILEGDYTNVPIEYFEGLKSSAETNENKLEIKSVGKNLIDVKFDDLLIGNNIDGNSGEVINSYYKHMACSKDYKYINSIGDCVLSYETNDTHYLEKILFYDKNYNFISSFGLNYVSNGTNINFNIPNNAYYYKLTFRDNLGVTDGSVLTNEIFNNINIQLEKGTKATQYEPYKENVTTITLAEPLRSLPNGVKDEIFVHDDKVVVTRNVGQVVIDGSEDWYRHNLTDTETNNKFIASANFSSLYPNMEINLDDSHKNALADNILIRFDRSLESLYCINGVFVLSVNMSNLTEDSIDSFKSWLLSNKITLAFQIATPTYEWFELPSPRLFKNGHVFIDSGAIPLTTTKHEVNTSIRSAIDTNTNELWDVKNDIIDTNERINEIVDDMYTESSMVITNDNNTFTMSDIAKDTSDTEIVLNGRTLVNLWGNKTSDFYIQNTANATFDNGFITVNGVSGSYIHSGSKRLEMFKPSTTYTVITNVTNNTLDGKFYIQSYTDSGIFELKTLEITSGTTGIIVDTLVTKSDLSGKTEGLRSISNNDNTTGKIKFQCIILEGDYTNVPISYFEGLQSANPTKLLSFDGKNLFNINEIVEDENWTVTNNEVSVNVTQTGKYYSKEVNLKLFSDGNYTITCELDDTSATWLELYENGTYKNKITSSSLVNMSTKKEYTIKLLAFNVVGKFKFKNIKIEVGRIATQYEPYKGDSITLPTIEPLRSLPNGVHDTAELKDDKLVITRNCGEVVLNGSENWAMSGLSTEGYNGFYCQGFLPTYSLVILSDKFKYLDVDNWRNLTLDSFITSDYGTIDIRMSNTIVSDLATFKTWLQSNNVTVVYQLATPTMETYDLRTLHIYKHFFAETGAIPLTNNEHLEHYHTANLITNNTEEIINTKKGIERIDNKVNALPILSFNESGELVVTINGVSKTFVPKTT